MGDYPKGDFELRFDGPDGPGGTTPPSGEPINAGPFFRELRVMTVEHFEVQQAELARLRAEVGRLIAAWPGHGESRGVVQYGAGDWRVAGVWLPHPTREAAVRAAAGLDAGSTGDGSTDAGPATHGEGEGR